MTKKFNKSTIALGLLLSFSQQAAMAQESNDNKKDEDSKIEVISVMSTKRVQSIQEVPISVMAYTGEEIVKSGIEEIEDLGTFTPNLFVSKSSMQSSQTIGIRGVGTVANAALEPSVATYIDGVYMARPGALLGTLSDIEMVEVLRGPQGTLFGRNASMGAVSIRTKAPELDNQFIDVSAGIGNYGALDTSITANSNLTDEIAARFNFNYSTDDGYGENLFDGNDKVGEKDSTLARASFLYEPSADFNALLRFDYQKMNGTGLPIELDPNSVTPERIAILNAFGALPEAEDGEDYIINQIHNDTMVSKQWGTALELNWDNVFGDYSIKSTSSYREWDNHSLEDGVVRIPLDLLARESDYASTSISQEVQLISPLSDTYDYVAGVYYYQEDYSIAQTFNLGTAFCPIAVRVKLAGKPQAVIDATTAACLAMPQQNATPADFDQSTTSLAAYYQGTWHVTDKLDITGGIRYSDDDKDATMVVAPTNAIAGSFLAGAEDHQLNFTDSQVTWLLNTKYQVDSDLMVFATASTGFKAGGFNSVMTGGGLTADQRILESEEVTNYELGVKSTLLDGSMTANATLFRTDIDNFQDRSFKGLEFLTSNVGELRQQGLELEANLYPTDEITLRASYAYLDSEFLDYKGATNLPGLEGTQDLTGAPNRRSPKNQISLFAEYADSIPNTNLDWYARVESNWVDDTNIGATTNNNPQDIQDAHALTNIRFGLIENDETWNVQLYVENVMDQTYCLNRFNQPFGEQFKTESNGGTLVRCVMGTPRTFGIRASYHFE